jgi:hypothetical protein
MYSIFLLSFNYPPFQFDQKSEQKNVFDIFWQKSLFLFINRLSAGCQLLKFVAGKNLRRIALLMKVHTFNDKKRPTLKKIKK